MTNQSKDAPTVNGGDMGISTSDLAKFVSSLSYEDIPNESVRLIERAILDTIGVTLAGTTSTVTDSITATVESEHGETTVLGREERLPLHDAVFVNGTASHCLDFDDVALAAMDGHPSVPLVAPLLAVGEREQSTGRELITAFAAGFETQCYLSQPISPGHYERGWHATSTIGTFGATAAVANLLDLPPEKVEHALNSAASMAAGLKRNFGSMTKPVHVGQAARSGTSAALSAAAGLTADKGAIDGEQGFLDLYAGASTPNHTKVMTLGEHWALRSDGIDVKKYPCCYYTHAAIYGAIRLAKEYEIDSGAVTEVSVTASQGAADALSHDDPSCGLEAKFSMEYVLAYGLTHGTVDLAAFENDRIEESTVQNLRERVSFTVDPELPYDSNAAQIRIRTDDVTHKQVQKHPPGTHDDPLSIDELHEKFRMCANRAELGIDIDVALETLDSLRAVENTKTLLEYL